MNIKFVNYQKFDHNTIRIIEYSDIIKFYNTFEKSTRFYDKIFERLFDKEKLVKYAETKPNLYTFDNNEFVYKLKIEIVDINKDLTFLLLTEVVANRNDVVRFTVEHIFST